MASKSAQHEPEKAEVIEEALDHVDTTLDRVKVLYEQFFLGIQKQPPTHLHTDVDRKLRELQQMQIRNTALRYRFATIQQKFGSYNNYWRRTLRQIENGTYHRNLAKIGRQAAATGEDIPDEILAAMPKRMREQVKRDREAALAQKRRREGTVDETDFLDEVATGTSAAPRVARDGAHVLDDDDGDFDLDAYFRAVTNDDAASSASLSAAGDHTNPEVHAFTSEVATDADLIPPPKPAAPTPPTRASSPMVAPTTTRASSPTVTPVQGNAAVRAAVGMRIATPPAGVPLPSRPTPAAGLPARAGRPSQPIAAQSPPPAGSSMQDSQAIPTQVIPTMPSMPSMPTMSSRQSRPSIEDSQVIPTQAIPTMRAGLPPQRPTAPGLPSIPAPGQSGAPRPATPLAPSQVARPLPVMPGAASNRGPVAVETLAGPFPRGQASGSSAAQSGGHPTVNPSGGHPATRTATGLGASRPGPPPPPGSTQAIPRPPPPGSSTGATQAIPRPPGASGSSGSSGASGSMGAQPVKPMRATTEPGVGAPAGGRAAPPPGMTDADVNALYSKYVKAKEAVGEKAGPGAYGKLLQTINAQAPKIMEQYKAKGVEFQVVVKDNQVVIRAKPKP